MIIVGIRFDKDKKTSTKFYIAFLSKRFDTMQQQAFFFWSHMLLKTLKNYVGLTWIVFFCMTLLTYLIGAESEEIFAVSTVALRNLHDARQVVRAVRLQITRRVLPLRPAR